MKYVKLTVLAFFSALVLSGVALAQDEKEAAPGDAQEILAELTEALELNEEQQQQVAGHLQTFALAMSEATETADDEEQDPQATLGAIKAARADFKKGMMSTLTEEQYQKYEAMIDAIVQEMFEDIAEIKIMDLEEPLELTEEQAAALKPIMGTSVRKLVGILYEYGDKKLTAPKKIKMAKKLKAVKAEMEKGMKTVLSEEQMDKYTAYKEAQKAESEG